MQQSSYASLEPGQLQSHDEGFKILHHLDALVMQC